MKHPINEEHFDYYEFLEDLRCSGVTNMYGATPYLMAHYPKLSREEVRNILAEWMSNYSELKDMFNW